MIHYSCDRCQRRIDSLEEIRYIVRIEIQATIDSVEPDDEGDHLMEIEEILERLEEADCQELSEASYSLGKYKIGPGTQLTVCLTDGPPPVEPPRWLAHRRRQSGARPSHAATRVHAFFCCGHHSLRI